MNNLPGLVQELIDWYQWKNRTKRTHVEFLSFYRVYYCGNNFYNCIIFNVNTTHPLGIFYSSIHRFDK